MNNFIEELNETLLLNGVLVDDHPIIQHLNKIFTEADGDPTTSPATPDPQQVAKQSQSYLIDQISDKAKKVDDVKILRKDKDGKTAMVRVKGKDAKGGPAIYRYLLVDGETIQKVTGSPDLTEINIHNYVHKFNKEFLKRHEELKGEPEKLEAIKSQYLGMYSASPLETYKEITKTTDKPSNFIKYLKQRVGPDHRTGIANALSRMKDGIDTRAALDLVLSADDNYIERLMYAANSQDKSSRADVIKFIEKLESIFNPSESKSGQDNIIAEIFGSDTIKGLAASAQRMMRKLGRALTPEDIKLGKRIMLYVGLAKGLINLVKRKREGTREQVQQPAQQSTQEPTLTQTITQPVAQLETESTLDHANYFSKLLTSSNADFIEKFITAINDNRFVMSFAIKHCGEINCERRIYAMIRDLKGMKYDSNSDEYDDADLNAFVSSINGYPFESFNNYGNILIENPDIEDLRLSANDLARATYDLYNKRSKELNRANIDGNMYDEELQYLFNGLLDETKVACDLYLQKLSITRQNNDNKFAALIECLELTKNPISELMTIKEYLNDSDKVISEHYNIIKSNLIPISTYIPISNVI